LLFREDQLRLIFYQEKKSQGSYPTGAVRDEIHPSLVLIEENAAAAAADVT